MSSTASRPSDVWYKPANLASYVPGLALVLAIALVTRFLIAPLLPKAVGEVIVAIAIGLLIGNLVALPDMFKKGVRFSLHSLLRLAIVLLGVRLSFLDVLRIGFGALGIIVVCISIALVLTYYLGRLFNVPARLATLIGVGTAICGNSAIIATAPAIKAKDEEVSFAVATITLFGTLAVFLYPLLGRLLGLPDPLFGTWAGTAVNDTSQVVATGFAYSTAAGDIATVVKLVRNTLMAPVIFLLSALYVWSENRRNAAGGGRLYRTSILKVFPLFVLGYLGMALLNTFGAVPKNVADGLYELARFLVLMALAGVGLGTSVATMRRTGLKPFYIGLCTACVVAAVSLALVSLFVRA